MWYLVEPVGAILKRTGQAADFGAIPRPVWKHIGSSALVSDSMVKAKVKMMVARGGIEPPARAFFQCGRGRGAEASLRQATSAKPVSASSKPAGSGRRRLGFPAVALEIVVNPSLKLQETN